MTDTLDLEPSKLDSASKRGRVESELRDNPQRSDREIARVVGCDHKTVGSARAKISPQISPDAPSPTERRQMLINATKDFNAKFPDQADGRTAEEQVDIVLAKGIVSLDPAMAKVVQGAVDQCNGALMRDRKTRQEAADAAGERNEERTILPAREEITIQHDAERGSWILRQRRWPDEDAEIIVGDEDIHEFVEVLTDHLGYGRAG